MNRSTARKQTLAIGEVSESKLEKVTELLGTVDIVKDEISAWNCQDWSLDALVKLQTEGFVDEQYSKEAVKVGDVSSKMYVAIWLSRFFVADLLK